MGTRTPLLVLAVATALASPAAALLDCGPQDDYAGCACEHTACVVLREKGVRALTAAYHTKKGTFDAGKGVKHRCKFHRESNQCKCICGDALSSQDHVNWLESKQTTKGVKGFWSDELQSGISEFTSGKTTRKGQGRFTRLYPYPKHEWRHDPNAPKDNDCQMEGWRHNGLNNCQRSFQSKEELYTAVMLYCENPFVGAAKHGRIGTWDVSQITDMSYLFVDMDRADGEHRCQNFNEAITYWNTKAVTDMHNMFENLRQFDQPIGQWDVSNVRDMNEMLKGCSDFNQDLSSWDTSGVVEGGCSNVTSGTPLSLHSNVFGFQKPPCDHAASKYDDCSDVLTGQDIAFAEALAQNTANAPGAAAAVQRSRKREAAKMRESAFQTWQGPFVEKGVRASQGECIKWCANTSTCTAWTYELPRDGGQGYCFLMGSEKTTPAVLAQAAELANATKLLANSGVCSEGAEAGPGFSETDGLLRRR